MLYKKFGRLTVLEECENRYSNREKKYKCICDCGNITYVRGSDIRGGTSRSCGCLAIENTIKRSTKHGKSHTKLYKVYYNMKDRCYNIKCNAYKNYGARGIKVCDEWLSDFMTFYNWAMDNGYQDDLTIDRIDVNGNYEPTNCRWVDMKIQQNNKRNNIYLTYNNKRKTIKEWAEELQIAWTTISSRHKKGWTDKECLLGKENKILYKYDYKTNTILKSYNSIKDASLDNDISQSTIFQEVQKHILHTSQRGFYFGYSPKLTVKIYCYDNESLALLDIYCSIKEASEKTKVRADVIIHQCSLKTKLNNRIKGSTGLFFEKKL